MKPTVIDVPIEQLEISSGNPRLTSFTKDIEDSLDRGENIREAIDGYWNLDRSKVLIWDGGRRFNAARKKGLKTINNF